MLQLRCNNKIELNSNSFIGRGTCTVGELPDAVGERRQPSARQCLRR
jgi:hypothetical protein